MLSFFPTVTKTKQNRKKSETFYVFGRNKCSTTISMSAIHKAFFHSVMLNFVNAQTTSLQWKWYIEKKNTWIKAKKSKPISFLYICQIEAPTIEFRCTTRQKNTFTSVKKIRRYTEQNVLKIQKKNSDSLKTFRQREHICVYK